MPFAVGCVHATCKTNKSFINIFIPRLKRKRRLWVTGNIVIHQRLKTVNKITKFTISRGSHISLRWSLSWSNWNLECWFLRKAENRSTRREPTTNSTHMWCRAGWSHISGRRALSSSSLCHSCSSAIEGNRATHFFSYPSHYV